MSDPRAVPLGSDAEFQSMLSPGDPPAPDPRIDRIFQIMRGEPDAAADSPDERAAPAVPAKPL